MQVQQLRVVNPSNGVVVVTPDSDRPKSYLRFEATGDPEGGDVVYVSRDTAMQTAFIKAVKRGVLKVEGIEEDQELFALLKVTPGGKRASEPAPLTVKNVEFDEKNSYKATTVEIPVIIDPLAKV
ncbi:hypothetical protein ABZS76_33155 [Streptomyces sp. NPDC005562]|uniref:hypothetical protein n=1 Tax=Streptomyces sp. NPDC005562 TaxID=3154890 RepID=UPI0033B70CAD